MSEFYQDYEPKEDIRRKNEEYLNEVKNEVKNETKKENMAGFKKVIFNRFYFELIAYFLILILGVIINALTYTSNLEYMAQVGISIFSTILVCFMMAFLGYMSAKKREGIKKYTTVFYITLIFGIVTIIRVILSTLGWETGVATLFIYANNLFIESTEIIFSWLTVVFKANIGYACVMITLLMMFLGVRKNIVNDRKQKNRR